MPKPKRARTGRPLVRHHVLAELEQPLVAIDDAAARRMAKEDRRDAATVAGIDDALVAKPLVASWRAEWEREDRKAARRAAKAEAERQAAEAASVESWREAAEATAAEPVVLVATRVPPLEIEAPRPYVDPRLLDAYDDRDWGLT